MAIGKITGPMLFSNLERQGVNLAIDANLAYYDVTNRFFGINTTAPAYALDSAGNARIGNILIAGNTISSNSGKLNLGSLSNITLSGGSANYIIYTDGNGNLSFGNLSTLITSESFTANAIPLGSNIAGSLVSNAVTLTTTTDVTDAITQLNQVLGKLVPNPPANFPGGQSLSLTTATTSALMANFTQTDNTAGNTYQVAGGTLINTVRSSSYATSTIANVGPGSTGTVGAYLNGVLAGNTTLTGSSNGTYGNLIITNNQDYHNVVSNVAAGFWTSFSASLSGSNVPAGWNTAYIADSTTGNTNPILWYYDNSAPSAPTFTATSFVVSSNVVTYSSTIPHFTSAAGFTITGNVNNLSGDTYPNSTYLATGLSGGAFNAPASVTYAAAGVTTPLARNLYVASGNVKFTTTANIVSTGFGSSATGPSIVVNNGYNLTSQLYLPGSTVLYKNGTGNQIEETSLTVGASVGSGSGNAYRIANPGSTDTPAYTGTEAAFNSQTTPLQTYDATVVASILKFDQTNYSTYLPAGPNLSTQGASQYFTFRFVRAAVSKFNILYTGTIAGLWVALPGSTIDTSSGLNGWLTMATAYAGSGVPGTGTGGNGSNGCALGGTAVLNAGVSGGSYTATFGTVSSSSTTNNYIYVRVKLVTGQSLSALSIQAPTN